MIPLIIISEEKVLAPAKVWSPVVTTPPLVASAGAKLNTPASIVPPLTLEVFAMDVIETDTGVSHVATPLLSEVKTFP